MLMIVSVSHNICVLFFFFLSNEGEIKAEQRKTQLKVKLRKFVNNERKINIVTNTKDGPIISA